MSLTIRQLWNGHLAPVRYSGAESPEIKEVLEAIDLHLDALQEDFSEKEKLLLELYRSCVNDYIALCCEQAFCDGYSMGTRLTAEALMGSRKDRDYKSF